MHLGITGSSTIVTPRQVEALRFLLWHLRTQGFEYFHFGDCIEADAIGADIAVECGYHLWAHPPINPYKRAFHFTHRAEIPKDYPVRNRDIVDFGSLMIGIPDTDYEKLRSGTWSTLRYARKQGKPRIVLLP